MNGPTQNPTYLHFADLLDYPTPELVNQTRECISLLELDYPEAAEHLQTFLEYAETTPLGRLEEIYTGTFDVNPACYIFAGYLLFGESFNRGKFLVRLQEMYRERGFSMGNELADHLAVMFRFLATLGADDVMKQQLVEYCIVPALQKMNANFEDNPTSLNPYAQALCAISNVLERTQQAVPV